MTYNVLALLKYIGNDIAETFVYLPAGIIVFTAVLVFRKLMCRSGIKDDGLAQPSQNKVAALFVAYSVVVLFITFFPGSPAPATAWICCLLQFHGCGNFIAARGQGWRSAC